jgi:hypothetical protein
MPLNHPIKGTWMSHPLCAISAVFSKLCLPIVRAKHSPFEIWRPNLTELAVEAIDGLVSITRILGDSCKGGAQCMHVVAGAFTNNNSDFLPTG